MSKRTDPKPPAHLGTAGQAFWREMLAPYDLEAPDPARLQIAGEALDTIAEARKVLADGLDRVALSAWRDASKLYLSSVRQMGVDAATETTDRLPTLHQPRKVS